MRDYRPWSAEEVEQLRSLLAERLPARIIAKRMGRSVASVTNKMQAAALQALPRFPVEVAASAPQVDPDEPEYASEYTNRPWSVEDVVESFRIDLDAWEPYHVTPNVWQVGAKHPDTGEILVEDLYQIKIRFRRRADASLRQLAAQLVADIAAHVSRSPGIEAPAILLPEIGDVMAEFDLFDVHLAKYAWAQETGEPYDTSIAERIVKAALSDLRDQVSGRHRITQCLLPFGNDFFQTDTLQGTTTAGTQVDHDTRFQRMYRHGHALAMWMIEECAKLAPVHVPVVPGNHDATAAFTMGVVLEAEFRRDQRVTFDNSPKPRKYYRYGKTLLGFTHGEKEKPAQLPQLMPVECPQDWALSTCREFHIGHFHHGKATQPIAVDDKTGVTVRWIRSLSAADSWHTGKGFVGNQRSAEAFLWHREGGMRSHFISLPVTAYTIKPVTDAIQDTA